MLFLFRWKRKNVTPEQPGATYAGGNRNTKYTQAASWEPYVAPVADLAAIARKKRRRDDEFFILAMN